MTCRLCSLDVPLIKAHAIPEAFFRVLRQNGETPILISNAEGASHYCVARAASEIDIAAPEAGQRFQRVVDFAIAGRVGILGEDVFAYCVNAIDTHATVWLHLVYGRAAFLGLTCPKAWATEDQI